MRDSEQTLGEDQLPEAWEAPELETLTVDSTEGGAAPKNNENPNFYVG